MIETLRDIGRKLMAGLGGRPHGPEVVARGASGDKTHPVDKMAEDIILSGLGATGVPMDVISEEAGLVRLQGGGRTTVVVDPVDGSKNAVTGIPIYCTSIAVSSGPRLGDVETGYVINLVSGEEFWAERGKGAFQDGRPISSDRGDVLNLVLYEAQSPSRDLPRLMRLISACRRTRSLGAVALDLALVARGTASVFAAPWASRSFDFAAGWIIAREAGAVVTDATGGGMEGVELGVGRSVSILAAGNAGLHRKALSLID